MLIGNGDYKKFDVNEKIQKCPRCPSPENYCNLHLKESLVRLKKKLESFGYLVIAFLDLKEEEFLRVIKYFREFLDNLNKKCTILLYVGGHGFHSSCGNDYLVPIDYKLLYHENGHRVSLSYLCSLKVLLENFKSDDKKQFHIDCLWDLCRKM